MESYGYRLALIFRPQAWRVPMHGQGAPWPTVQVGYRRDGLHPGLHLLMACWRWGVHFWWATRFGHRVRGQSDD